MKSYSDFALTLLETKPNHGSAFKKTGRWGKMGAGCILGSTDNQKFLLPKRSSQVLEPHTWGVWGGAIDEEIKWHDILNKAVIAQDHAKRELFEESGFRGKLIRRELLTIYKSKGFEYYTFLFLTDSSNFEIRLNWETEKAYWLTIDQIVNLKNKHFGLKYVLDQKENVLRNCFKRN